MELELEEILELDSELEELELDNELVFDELVMELEEELELETELDDELTLEVDDEEPRLDEILELKLELLTLETELDIALDTTLELMLDAMEVELALDVEPEPPISTGGALDSELDVELTDASELDLEEAEESELDCSPMLELETDELDVVLDTELVDIWPVPPPGWLIGSCFPVQPANTKMLASAINIFGDRKACSRTRPWVFAKGDITALRCEPSRLFTWVSKLDAIVRNLLWRAASKA